MRAADALARSRNSAKRLEPHRGSISDPKLHTRRRSQSTARIEMLTKGYVTRRQT
jgi:hypothetical protein